jgi:hypothetical protein
MNPEMTRARKLRLEAEEDQVRLLRNYSTAATFGPLILSQPRARFAFLRVTVTPPP